MPEQERTMSVTKPMQRAHPQWENKHTSRLRAGITGHDYTTYRQ
jgi:hypothetical protein